MSLPILSAVLVPMVPGFAIWCERTVGGCPDSFVGVHRHAGIGDRGPGDCQSGWLGSVREEAFAAAQQDRKDPQPVFVNEVVPHQCLDEITASYDLDLLPRTILQRDHVRDDIVAEQGRVVPCRRSPVAPPLAAQATAGLEWSVASLTASAPRTVPIR